MAISENANEPDVQCSAPKSEPKIADFEIIHVCHQDGYAPWFRLQSVNAGGILRLPIAHVFVEAGGE